MNKILAVALLDIRRLGFGVLSGALIAGLVPALSRGVGGNVPADFIVMMALGVVGLAVGGNFGTDFTDGRASFFFARPLQTPALILGRCLALVVLATAAFVAVMSSHWLSTSDRTHWDFFILTWWHLAALGTGFSLSLAGSLNVASRVRGDRSPNRLRDAILIPVRLTLYLSAFILVFGLFADILVRAYQSPTPMKLFAGSWVVGLFIASVVAIVAGRADRIRISRFQSLVVYTQLGLTSAFLVGAWTYILHPGPAAIQRVLFVQGSPDGSSAFVQTTVDRGDPGTLNPVFVLDLASGQARRLNSDPWGGPWLSSDGRTLVWSEATPFFFRPIWRLLGGATTLRVRDGSGDVQPLSMPSGVNDGFKPSAIFGGMVDSVQPSPQGDVFAVQWERRLAFVSRSRGEGPEVKLGPGKARLRGSAFIASGDLRVALVREGASPSLVEFFDIDPNSGTLKPIDSVEAGERRNLTRVQFNSNATLALLTSSGANMARASVTLVSLDTAAGFPRATTLLTDAASPRAIFLADGRIAAVSGVRDQSVLKVFSPTGQPVRDTALGEGVSSLDGEMFPGLVAIDHSGSGIRRELVLLDCTTGSAVRRVPEMRSPLGIAAILGPGQIPPPGTAGARLLQSDGKLFELPSVTAEPRLLLPLPKTE